MFRLHESLPNEVEINGVVYGVDMSFDNVLNINEMLRDDELNNSQKVLIGCKLLFKDIPAGDISELSELFYEAYDKLLGGKEDEQEYDLKGNPMPKKGRSEEKVYYDLVQDAELIFASFFQYYKIDLHDYFGKMHYYKFRALLNGLGDDTIFQKVIEIRRRPLPTGKGSGKEAKDLRKLKKQWELKKR